MYFFIMILFFPGSGLPPIHKPPSPPGSGASEALLQAPGWEAAGARRLQQHPWRAGYVGQGEQLLRRPLPPHPASAAPSNRGLQFVPEAGLPTFYPPLCWVFHPEFDVVCHHR